MIDANSGAGGPLGRRGRLAFLNLTGVGGCPDTPLSKALEPVQKGVVDPRGIGRQDVAPLLGDDVLIPLGTFQKARLGQVGRARWARLCNTVTRPPGSSSSSLSDAFRAGRWSPRVWPGPICALRFSRSLAPQALLENQRPVGVGAHLAGPTPNPPAGRKRRCQSHRQPLIAPSVGPHASLDFESPANSKREAGRGISAVHNPQAVRSRPIRKGRTR